MKKGFLYILLTAVVFTTLEPVSKLISVQISPMSMTFLRFFIGGLILIPFAVAEMKKKQIHLDGKDYVRMALLGVLCIFISMVLLQYAVLKADSPALIAIVFSSNSVFTILFAAVFLKERITWIKVVSVCLCAAGVLVSADLSSSTNLYSIVLSILSALTFSLYTVMSKKYANKVSGVISTGFSFFFGSMVLLLVLILMGIPVFQGIDHYSLPILLYLGIVVTGIGYWSYFRAMEKSSAMAASFVFFIKPVLTPFAAFIINGIVPQGRVFIAMILVVASSVLAVGIPKDVTREYE